MIIICNKHSFPLEFECLTEAFNAPLAEADVVVANLCFGLKEGCNGATHYDCNGYRLVLLILSNSACRSLVVIIVTRILIIFLD